MGADSAGSSGVHLEGAGSAKQKQRIRVSVSNRLASGVSAARSRVRTCGSSESVLRSTGAQYPLVRPKAMPNNPSASRTGIPCLANDSKDVTGRIDPCVAGRSYGLSSGMVRSGTLVRLCHSLISASNRRKDPRCDAYGWRAPSGRARLGRPVRCRGCRRRCGLPDRRSSAKRSRSV